ncbi:MAG: PaaI family thioesterase [Rhizobiales bacterium]|nr:PaaI family thioesterase [Hyphomicrobiales bacterium]
MGQFNLNTMQIFLDQHFPQSDIMGKIVKLGNHYAEMLLAVDESHLRPGGTISGPTMMALADVSMYCAILNEIGPKLHTVTTNLNINFLRKPKANAPILAKANVLKIGKTLAMGEVAIYSVNDKNIGDEMVAHATVTYSIPKN